MNSQWKTILCRPCLVIAACLAVTISLTAQVKTTTTETEGAPSQEMSVEQAEVVYVNGNDLVVKMDNGEIRHLPNIPETARATVDGKELSVHELKPGMKLQRTITVTTTPKTITTVQTVTGKVFSVMPPNSVILTLENGQNQKFKVPKGQKFTVDGAETDVFSLKKGMVVSATKITEEPVTVAEQKSRVSGQSPPPPPPPPSDAPILIAQAEPAPAPAPAAEPEPTSLPKTGSFVPLMGLMGLVLTGLSFGLRFVRR
jgi:LPXTG-motif cell wall-anchored protein